MIDTNLGLTFFKLLQIIGQICVLDRGRELYLWLLQIIGQLCAFDRG